MSVERIAFNTTNASIPTSPFSAFIDHREESQDSSQRRIKNKKIVIYIIYSVRILLASDISGSWFGTGMNLAPGDADFSRPEGAVWFQIGTGSDTSSLLVEKGFLLTIG